MLTEKQAAEVLKAFEALEAENALLKSALSGKSGLGAAIQKSLENPNQPVTIGEGSIGLSEVAGVDISKRTRTAKDRVAKRAAPRDSHDLTNRIRTTKGRTEDDSDINTRITKLRAK